jgi:transcriptional regulator with XRE-family HTH domain
MPTITPLLPPRAPQFSGARLRAARRAAGLSAIGLAGKIGRDVSTIVRYERGRCSPSADVLGALSVVLDVAIDELYERPAERPTGR